MKTISNSCKRNTKENLVNNENIPPIRFNGFDEEWTDIKLKDSCTITMGQSPSSTNYTDNPKDTVLIQGNQDLINGLVVSRVYTTEITKKSAPGDIILTVRAPVGDIAINKYNACIGRGVCSLSNMEDKTFIYYYLEYLSNKHVWNRYSQGSTFESINSKDIKNLKIKIPSLKEQNKISDLISAIDDKISFMEKKHNYLIKIRKYFLKYLFCYHENIPQLRFPEFVGDWKKTKLGNIVIINSGQSPKKILDDEGIIPYFKVEQLNKSHKYLEVTPYYTNIKNPIKKGSIIFPKRGMSIMLNKVKILKQDSYMDTNLMTLTITKGFNNEFLYYLILKEKLSKIADTTSIPQLNNKHIKPYSIKIPSFNEQNKIAIFLSKIDKKIELMEKEVKYNKKFKETLLSKMFC